MPRTKTVTSSTAATSAYHLKHTAFFPLTGNPFGFHHLMVAECVVRQCPEIENVVFILSNGKHPDPTKSLPSDKKQVRLEVLQAVLQEWHNPENSHVARLMAEAGEKFLLAERKLIVSTVEFVQEFAFRLSDHLQYIRQQSLLETRSLPVRVIIGADLIHRMLNPKIFSDSDLQQFLKSCEFLAASREQFEVQQEFQAVEAQRGVALNFIKIQGSVLPEKLQPFLQLSSTSIRKSIQARHQTECLLPNQAGRLLQEQDLYQQQTHTIEMNEWQASCWEGDQQLEKQVWRLKGILDQRAAQQLPHTLAFVETSTGGKMAAAFNALPGASQHFIEGVVAYHQDAKKRLLGKTAQGHAVVSENMALALAQKFQKTTSADFVLAETGMAGPPEEQRHSPKNGQCYLALATPDQVSAHLVQTNPFLTKQEHQLQFALQALEWMIFQLKTT